jgi:uncharacterized protein
MQCGVFVRIVLDTNVLVSALISTHTPPALLYDAWDQGLFELATSPFQLDEFARVITYPKLQRFIKPHQAEVMIRTLTSKATLPTSIPEITASADPDDNHIIGIAAAAQAAYLVTGDKADILHLRSIGSTHIVHAREMASILRLEVA